MASRPAPSSGLWIEDRGQRFAAVRGPPHAADRGRLCRSLGGQTLPLSAREAAAAEPRCAAEHPRRGAPARLSSRCRRRADFLHCPPDGFRAISGRPEFCLPWRPGHSQPRPLSAANCPAGSVSLMPQHASCAGQLDLSSKCWAAVWLAMLVELVGCGGPRETADHPAHQRQLALLGRRARAACRHGEAGIRAQAMPA